jgi:histidinol dehydrogenase
MRLQRFEWGGPAETADAVRGWAIEELASEEVVGSVAQIGGEVFAEGDTALLRLTEELDDVALTPAQLKVEPDEAEVALQAIPGELREAMEVAAANVRAVAEAQTALEPRSVALPQGQTVAIREQPVAAAGIYAPGGRAAYPSSVLMCGIPARVAGVERLVLASPPGAGGRPADSILAAAALCGIDEIYAVGGAQAIFAFAFGTESIARVDVVVGPGSSWVQEAKKRAFGFVGIDSYAGPSELMVIAGHDADPEWIALDLCAQAEHGAESPLIAVAVEEHVLDGIGAAVERAASTRASTQDAPLALVQVPDLSDAIDLANAFAPEHLELIEEDAALLAGRVTTAGCVFVGRYGATAFGDYVAGSNHVLPTAGAGRFSGPLGPAAFRRKISTVEVTADAASKLAPYADVLARAEGFPVHGESAMIRAEDD